MSHMELFSSFFFSFSPLHAQQGYLTGINSGHRLRAKGQRSAFLITPQVPYELQRNKDGLLRWDQRVSGIRTAMCVCVCVCVFVCLWL